MSAEMLRDARPFPGANAGELAMIEFQTQLPAANASAAFGLADSWLEGQSSVVERLRVRATAIGRETHPIVAIQGESGSGKLRVAQWVHRCSRRADRPLMVLDPAAAPIDHQLDRVLRSLGRDSEMTPGTIVIRNFHVLPPPAIQRLLELMTVQGPDVRCGLSLITDRDVGELRGASLQHAQLLGRAGNTLIHVPPLRSRTGDVQFLARRFVHDAARRYCKPARGISPQAVARLDAHPFPGNIHELRAIVEQAVLRSSGDWITAECFPGIGENSALRNTEQAEIVIRLPGSSLREIEMQALKLALRLSGGRIVRASELLGITRHALRRKLEKFGLSDLRAHFDNVPNMGGPDDDELEI
jgi:DNA-binding NtrC family response regulator